MLREYEKNHFGQNGRRYMRRFPNPSLYSRCVIWAADPDVLKKYLIQDGKFTLDKLLQDISDKNTSVLQGTILPKDCIEKAMHLFQQNVLFFLRL